MQASLIALIEMMAGDAGVALLPPISSLLTHQHPKLRALAVQLLACSLRLLLSSSPSQLEAWHYARGEIVGRSSGADKQTLHYATAEELANTSTANTANADVHTPAAAVPHLRVIIQRLLPFLVPAPSQPPTSTATDDAETLPPPSASTAQVTVTERSPLALIARVLSRRLSSTRPNLLNTGGDLLGAHPHPNPHPNAGGNLLDGADCSRDGDERTKRL